MLEAQRPLVLLVGAEALADGDVVAEVEGGAEFLLARVVLGEDDIQADAAFDEPAVVPSVRAPAHRRRHAHLRAVLAVAVPARDFALPLAADVAIAVLLLPAPVAAHADGQRLRVLGHAALDEPGAARFRGEGLRGGRSQNGAERQPGQRAAKGRGKGGGDGKGVRVCSEHG